MVDLYGAIDLGGTKVRALVAGLDGGERGYDLRPSETDLGLESVLQRMTDSLAAAAVQAGVEPAALRGVGIASPGAIDVPRGIVAGAPQLPGWRDVPLVRLMSERLGVPATLENDASAAALGEHRYGAGRGTRHMLYFTVSTGIGGGIIIAGRLYTGATGAAGELGHMIIDMNSAETCPWCERGCLESLASGTAIARRGEDLAASGRAPVLARLRSEEGAVTSEMMARAMQAGDGACREVFREAGRYMGIGLANYVNIFNPEAVVVGGGVSRSGPDFFEAAREKMYAHAIRALSRDARLELAGLGEKSGLMGMIARMADVAGA
jgi:glucokinase